MSRRVGMLTVIFILGILFTVAASAGATFVPFASHRVLPNVYTGDVNLEGMTREQGLLKLRGLAAELKQETVILNCGQQTRKLSLASIDVDIDSDTVMDQALKAGQSGPLWKRWSDSKRIRDRGTHIPLAVKLNREKLRREVDNLFAEIIHPPVDASFRVTPGDKVEIVPGRNGIRIDHEALYNDLINLLSSGSKPHQLELAQVNVPPNRTEEDVRAMGIKGLLSSYTTRFNPGQVDRTYNVRVAAAALDGLLLPPGKEVSFNKVVGPRSTEAGYKNAKIIVNNEFVEGLGGGVCQVSSTLYNAVLLADLTVTERSNHSLPVSYVPIGRDATVVYEYRDFRFQNTHDSCVLVKSSAGYNTLTFKIFGNTDNNADVAISSWVTEVIEPEVVYENDPNLVRGQQVVKQEGARGYKTSGQVTITQDGKTITKPLADSYYKPMDKIIAVGIKNTGSTPEIPGDELPADSGGETLPGGETPPDDNQPGKPTGEGHAGEENNAEPGQAPPPEPVGEGRSAPDGNGQTPGEENKPVESPGQDEPGGERESSRNGEGQIPAVTPNSGEEVNVNRQEETTGPDGIIEDMEDPEQPQ